MGFPVCQKSEFIYDFIFFFFITSDEISLIEMMIKQI